jgi:glycosyltransferase involved in cell wall biosynthesis
MRAHRRIAILGTRGIPASHGGFETFAEHLALYLVARRWNVTVYCQAGRTRQASEDVWQGVRRIQVPTPFLGAKGTVVYDLRSTLHAVREGAPALVLGYNTAIFSALYRLRGVPNLINMDGIEWRREKWGALARSWLYLNERLGCLFANHLIADHPHIKAHLATRVAAEKISVIPYGADLVENAEAALLAPFGVKLGRYAVVIARPEPENSIFEIVSAFSRRRRGVHLVVLGKLEPQTHAYHRMVASAASDEVVFPGAIYAAPVVAALRYCARLYVHGHTVGGCNPSLVEALGAGNPVLAHDNPFNRWVAGPEACYFKNTEGCARQLDALLADDARLAAMAAASRERFLQMFTWEDVLRDYERLLLETVGPLKPDI